MLNPRGDHQHFARRDVNLLFEMRDFDFGLSEYDSSLFLLYFFAFPNTWYAHSGFK